MNKKKYYYPENLTAKPLFLKYWTPKDLIISFSLILLTILMFMFLRIWLTLLMAVVYAFMTMRINYNYSVLKLMKLYVRYLITDELVIKRR